MVDILPISPIMVESLYSQIPNGTVGLWLPFVEDPERRIVILPLPKDGPGVEVANVASFPQRQVIGSDEMFQHEWLSGLVQDSWQGGGQVLDADAATQLDRYYDLATLDTRRPHQLELPPRVVQLPITGTGNCVIIGDFRAAASSTWNLYIARNTDLWSVTGETATDTTLNLGFVPVGKSEYYSAADESVMLIPYGANGYQTFNGTALSSVFNTTNGFPFHPVSFKQFSDGLFALDDQNQLWRTGFAPSSNNWTKLVRINGKHVAKHLDIYMDATGAPMLVVITDSRMLTVDVGTALVYETKVTWPSASIAAGSSCTWGTNFYVTYGADLIEYTGSTWKAVGLKRDSGIASTNRASLVDICEGWNEVIGLLSLDSPAGAYDPELMITGEGGIPGPTSQSEFWLLSRDEFGGWHSYWKAVGLKSGFEQVITTRQGNGFAAVWTVSDKAYRMELNPDFLNPGATLTCRHQMEGDLISSWFYPVGKSQHAIAVSVEMLTRELSLTGGRIQVRMQVDYDTSPWFDIFDIDSTSELSFNGLGYEAFLSSGSYGLLPDGGNSSNGIGLGRFRYWVHLETDDDQFTPSIKSLAFAFMPVMGELQTFTFRADLSNEGPNHAIYGRSATELRQLLGVLATAKTLIGFSYGKSWHMCKLVGANGYDQTGADLRGDRAVSLVEAFRP